MALEWEDCPYDKWDPKLERMGIVSIIDKSASVNEIGKKISVKVDAYHCFKGSEP